MGADTGTGSRWAVVMLVYFILYFIIAYSVFQTSTTYGLTGINDPGTGPFALYAVPTCDNPRGNNTIAPELQSDPSSLSCDLVNTESTCSLVTGCYWQPAVGGFFGTTPAFCNGDNVTGHVNLSYLYNGNVPPEMSVFIDGSVNPFLHNATTISFQSLSTTPQLQTQTVCQDFGFTFYGTGSQSYASLVAQNSDGSAIRFIATLFGFTTDLGIPQPYAFILAIILTYIPLLIFVLIIRMMLPA